MAALNSFRTEDPWSLFTALFAAARKAPEIQYPHAFCLSTVSPEGWPEGRIVLLHKADPEGGFVFATDNRSPKVAALAACPRAALTLYWPRPLEVQVRIQGEVAEAPAAVADRVFVERPERSRITAWASTQSAPVADREALDALYHQAAEALATADSVGRPPHWRAYALTPHSFEFWSAGSRRLHDRVRFLRHGEGDGWSRQRLQP